MEIVLTILNVILVVCAFVLLYFIDKKLKQFERVSKDMKDVLLATNELEVHEEEIKEDKGVK